MLPLSVNARRILEYLDTQTDLDQRFPDVVSRALGFNPTESEEALHELTERGLLTLHSGGWYNLTADGRAWLDDNRQQGDVYNIYGDYAADQARIIHTEGGTYVESAEKLDSAHEGWASELAGQPLHRRRWVARVAAGVVILALVLVAFSLLPALLPSASPPSPAPASDPTSPLPRRDVAYRPELTVIVSLEVRKEPGADADMVAIADPGEVLTVVEDWDTAVFKVGMKDQWIQVRTQDGVGGWAAAEGLDFSTALYPLPLDDAYLGRDGERGPEDDLGPRHFTDWHLMAAQGEPVFSGPNGGIVVKVNRCTNCTPTTPSASDQNEALRDADWGWGHGNYVIVRYPNLQLPRQTREMLASSGLEGGDVFCLYGHLDTISITEGQALPPHAQIGTVGRTGFALDPHLEIEVHIGFSESAEPIHHLTAAEGGVELYIGPSPDTRVLSTVNPGDYLIAQEAWDTVSVKLGHAGQMIKVRVPSREYGWQEGWVDARYLTFTHMDRWLSLIWFEPDILFRLS